MNVFIGQFSARRGILAASAIEYINVSARRSTRGRCGVFAAARGIHRFIISVSSRAWRRNSDAFDILLPLLVANEVAENLDVVRVFLEPTGQRQFVAKRLFFNRRRYLPASRRRHFV